MIAPTETAAVHRRASPLAFGVATLALVLLTTSHAHAQPSLADALALYGSAAYDEALEAFDRLATTRLDHATRLRVDRHRVQCLLALDRTADAQRLLAWMLELTPVLRLDPDASPRLVRALDEARRAALPGIAYRRYRQAKRLYDERRFPAAEAAFAEARAIVAEGRAAGADDATLADLEDLAAGFEELSRVAARRPPS